MDTLVTRRRVVLGASLALVVAAFSAQSCGSEKGSTFDDSGPCGTIYKGLCGQPCGAESACPNGLYCSGGPVGGTCRADCSPGGGECTAGTSCSASGTCVSGTQGFGDAASISDGGGGGGDACIDLAVTLGKVTPTVVLLVDQSSSMSDPFGGGATRWDVVRDVLMNADGGIVKALEGDVTFGLSLYTRAGGFPQDASTCPRLLSVAPGGGYAAMSARFADSGGPTGGTPTGQSIDALIGRVNGAIVAGGFATLATPGPKVIVLATDGEPDICANGDDEDAGRKLALASAQAAFAAGIRIYVIGVGDNIGAVRLKEMANAGSGQPIDVGDAAPFSTKNRQEFVDAMNTITTGVRSCSFTLGGQVEKGQESRGTVLLDGTSLAFNDPNGWRLTSPSDLEVLGTACNVIKTTGGKLVVRFPCGTFEVK